MISKKKGSSQSLIKYKSAFCQALPPYDCIFFGVN